LVIQIGAGAVNENERRQVWIGTGRKVNMMQLGSVRLNDGTGGRIFPRNPRRPDTGQNKEDKD
jgi:hypothetical protein